MLLSSLSGYIQWNISSVEIKRFQIENVSIQSFGTNVEKHVLKWTNFYEKHCNLLSVKLVKIPTLSTDVFLIILVANEAA